MKPPRRSSGSEEPLAKIPKKTHSNREGGDTDHVAEITQLKEKVAGMQRVISSKNNELKKFTYFLTFSSTTLRHF